MKEKNRVGRPRTTPKQSKKCKYFYLICVNFHGKDTLKLGISNNNDLFKENICLDSY